MSSKQNNNCLSFLLTQQKINRIKTVETKGKYSVLPIATAIPIATATHHEMWLKAQDKARFRNSLSSHNKIYNMLINRIIIRPAVFI